MKGIAHFLTGLALASFFPDVIEAAEAGSLLPILGGIGGLLPDTLDFKLVQFWEEYDVEIDPGPEPNAEVIADTVLHAIQQAYDTATSIHLRAHTIRLSADSWYRYTLEFIPDDNEIFVCVGPVVSTDKKSYTGADLHPLQTCRRKVPFHIHIQYQQRFDIDIFNGPSFLFKRDKESVSVHFLDWHRRWTHSLLLAPIIGILCALVTGWLINWSASKWAGLVCWIGFTAHVILDQLGFLGSSLWWPLSQRQTPGLGLFHASDSAPNFITVWLSLVLILYNLDRFSSYSYIPKVPYFAFGLGVPFIVILEAILRNQRQNTEIT